MKDFEETAGGLGYDLKTTKRMMELIQAQYDAKRSIDPNREFTDEERAEMIDAAKAAGGFDTTEKTDPTQIGKNKEENLKLLKELSAVLEDRNK